MLPFCLCCSCFSEQGVSPTRKEAIIHTFRIRAHVPVHSWGHSSQPTPSPDSPCSLPEGGPWTLSFLSRIHPHCLAHWPLSSPRDLNKVPVPLPDCKVRSISHKQVYSCAPDGLPLAAAQTLTGLTSCHRDAAPSHCHECAPWAGLG